MPREISPKPLMYALLFFSLIANSASTAQLAFPSQPPDRAKRATVIRNIDGDTLVLSGYGRSRLIGVLAPETLAGRHGKQWRCGEEATLALMELAPPGSQVLVQRTGTDVFDRPLVYLWQAVDPKVFINAAVIETGFASLDRKHRYSRRAPLDRSENSARKREVGLWSPGLRDCALVPQK